MKNLVVALAAIVLSHFALSHPLRAPLVARLGEKGFLGLYSLVAFATLGWAGWAFGEAPRGPLLFAPGDGAWIVASALTVVALVLLLGSLRGNPALPGAEGTAPASPTGVFEVTRHPMMWGIALWAIAHAIVMPDPRTLVLMGAMAVLALVGSALQDAKKRRLDPAWPHWQAQTRFVPNLLRLPGAGVAIWLAALAAWLAATWAHGPLGGIAAGVWRWLS
ncbi:NnrU family protein [Croceicoccus sp. BE223]|uniref:NnrU family protein n=1 Tax=Croceicoccus sp. BE223 TaxID=2817716 RepID=UPI00285F0E58|nr:NnrU family protein [Croceicoccus sp. BE223]MDR7100899.1 putative membrane protein [Croceicoccus sp. BE223]